MARKGSCRPRWRVEILQHHGADHGRRVVVVGRSKVVGQPTAAAPAGNHGAEVTVAHSETEDVVAETQQARDPVVAVSKPGLIGRSTCMRNRGRGLRHQRHPGRGGRRRRLRAVQPVVAAITPVPGGVGPVTTIMLLDQVVTAAERPAASPSRA